MILSFQRILARQRAFLAPLSAIVLGAGTGFTTVAVIEAANGNDARASLFWEAGTSALIAGCLTTAAAAKAEQLSRKLRIY